MPKNYSPLNAKDLQQIQQVMNDGVLTHFESIDSTNSWLMENGQCSDICISESQSLGRGRRGNTWVSPQSGSIYFSLCWCFEKVTKNWSLLGLVVGVAIAEALQELGLTQHGVKWPNDIFWQGKKMGGVLIETVGQTGKVVIGIGLNINMPDNVADKIDQQYTSLDDAIVVTKTEAKRDAMAFSRVELICTLIKHLNNSLKNFQDLQFSTFNVTWKKWDILQGELVSFSNQNTMVRGEVMGIDQYGRIGVRSDSGLEIWPVSNEISYYSSADIQIQKNEKS